MGESLQMTKNEYKIDKVTFLNYNSCYITIIIVKRGMYMPPKAKITKEMIINAAFEVARADGAENVNARTVSKKLGCSTQPVMYHFAKIEDMKKAVYERADAFHTQYLLTVPSEEDALSYRAKPDEARPCEAYDIRDARMGMLGIGLNYIRFAIEEPNLFRFLFQSGFVAENSVSQMIDSEALEPVISVMQAAAALSREQAKKAFLMLSMFTHGYASLIANNAFEYDEETMKDHLEMAFRGAVLAVQGDAE